MLKSILVGLTLLVSPVAMAQSNDVVKDQARFQVAQAVTDTTTQTKTPTQPASVTTTVKGGTFAADVLEWMKVIFVPIVGALGAGIAYKLMSWLGVSVDDSNRARLNDIIVNGLNNAATRAEDNLRTNTVLDVNVKNQVIADAMKYVQTHGKDTIKALGLDASDPKAVDAIRARIQTAIIDPMTPTNPALAKMISADLAARKV